MLDNETWDTICENCKEAQSKWYHSSTNLFLCETCYHQIKDDELKTQINFRTIKTCATCAFSFFSEEREDDCEMICEKHNIDVECNNKCDSYTWYVDYLKENEE